jgi:hypothetical protein
MDATLLPGRQRRQAGGHSLPGLLVDPLNVPAASDDDARRPNEQTASRTPSPHGLCVRGRLGQGRCRISHFRPPAGTNQHITPAIGRETREPTARQGISGMAGASGGHERNENEQQQQRELRGNKYRAMLRWGQCSQCSDVKERLRGGNENVQKQGSNDREGIDLQQPQTSLDHDKLSADKPPSPPPNNRDFGVHTACFAGLNDSRHSCDLRLRSATPGPSPPVSSLPPPWRKS